MNAEKLLRSPLPINRKAFRVVQPAAKEDVWLPEVKIPLNAKFSRNVLPVAEVHPDALHMQKIIGMKRGRMTIIGKAFEQSNKDKTQWVVRCDCGNYEHRVSILRWLGTDMTDMCIECRRREKLKAKQQPSLPPAKRNTLTIKHKP